MIIDKKTVIIAVAVVLVAALLVAVVLLREDEGDVSALDVLGDADGNSGEDKTAATEYYRIVLSGACSPEVADAARELETLIERSTGIDSGIAYDTEEVPARTSAIEILIGNTGRNSSAVAFEDLRAEDYLCRWIDGSLVVGGISNSATLTALKRFINDVMPYAAPWSLMSEDFEFSYHHEYDIDSIKLCGFEISDYSIVCDGGSLEYARILADGIAQRSGYSLDVAQRAPLDSVKEIALVTDATLKGSAYVEHNGEDIVVRAEDSYGMSVALAELYSALLRGASDTVTVDLPAQAAYQYVAPDMKLMAIMSEMTASESGLSAINDTVSEIKNALPDVIVFGGINGGVLDMIICGLPSDYSFVRSAEADGRVTAVAYRRSIVSVSLDERTEDGLTVTGVSLKRNAGGEEYQTVILTGSGEVGFDTLSEVIADSVTSASGASGAVVFSFIRGIENGDGVLSEDGLDTKYNSCIGVGDAEYRAAILCGDIISCEVTSVERNSAGNAAFVNLELGKICHADFLQYIQ